MRRHRKRLMLVTVGFFALAVIGTTTVAAADSTPPGDPQGIFSLWDNYFVFVSLAVASMGALGGIGSRSMAIGAFSSYLLFVYIAVETGSDLFINITYVTLVLIMIGMAFKLWRLEFGGDT